MRLVFKVADPNAPQPTTTTTTTATTRQNIPTSTSVPSWKPVNFPAETVEFNKVLLEDEIDIDTDLDFDSDSDNEGAERKRKRKRKKKKHHQRNKHHGHRKSHFLNDNPPQVPSQQVIEKELSLVEKVNNLMKQEVSIRAASGAAVKNFPHFLAPLLMLLVVICWGRWFHSFATQLFNFFSSKRVANQFLWHKGLTKLRWRTRTGRRAPSHHQLTSELAMIGALHYGSGSSCPIHCTSVMPCFQSNPLNT